MSTELNVYDDSYATFGDLQSNQYYFVEFSASRTVQKCSAVTAVICGIVQNNPKSGETAVVRMLGKSKIKTGEAITYGALVGCTAAGQAAAKSLGTNTTHYIVGQAIETTASGDVAHIVVKGNPARAA